MAQDEGEQPPPLAEGLPEGEATVPRRRRWRRLALGVSFVAVGALAVGWLSRERIVDNVVAGQFARAGVPAQYEIVSIGPRVQVLRNVVIGDPARPDLTIERVETRIEPRLGFPVLGRVTLVRPRLHGSLRGGRLSFGRLDPLIFTGSKQPFRLPDLDLAIVDGRARLDSDAGAVGLRIEGKGSLRDGFAGEIAAIGPRLAGGGCTVQQATLYGALRIAAERPRFSGPLRVAALDCAGTGLALREAGLQLDTTLDRTLDGADGALELGAGPMTMRGGGLGALGGTARFAFRRGTLTARYTLSGKGLVTEMAGARSFAVDGHLRAADGFAHIDTDGTLTGTGLRLPPVVASSLAALERSGAGTLGGQLAARIRAALQREELGSQLRADFTLRRKDGHLALIVPQAGLRGGSGQAVLALSRFQIGSGRKGELRLAGNFATGGEGLPRIAGRMDRPAGEPLSLRVTMPEYAAGGARLAMPELRLRQRADGGFALGGELRLSGPLPGGEARNLVLPLDGDWSPGGGLALWRSCVAVRFDSLALADLTLDRRQLRLCPPTGSAIVRSDRRGLRIAAGTDALDLTGRLGATPARIVADAVGLAWPGRLAARGIDVALGPADTASRFRIASLAATIGSEIAGSFGDTSVRLAGVPLDIVEAGGNWRYAGGTLSIGEAGFRLLDRQRDARFQPLVARDAVLRLADNRITAGALLREPASGREVVRTAIEHDLASGRGSAGLFVDALTFDGTVQPDTISRLALGVIANARGAVRGEGRIDWTPRAVTSSGRFATDSLDFAAAFGPVKGLSGTIRFTDLLGLVTAPDQYVIIPAMNPGIEVNDGRIVYALEPGLVLAVKSGAWPFLGGELRLDPTRMRMGAAEERRFTLRIDGLDSARLADRMDMENIAVTGVFDGVLPLAFDKDGGRIVDGYLASRLPGGNFSYIGELTYKDLSPMANFAFDALRSLNYRQMRVEMGGSLEGEILTRVVFDGISQGKGASRNFLTRRIAKLPIRFKVNIRAPFFQLASSLRSYYDPSFIRDPRTLGLLNGQGRPQAAPALGPDAAERPRGIQPAESARLP